jgi:hypothetical protein
MPKSGFSLAQAQLTDLEEPIRRRNGPWAFPHSNCARTSTIRELPSGSTRMWVGGEWQGDYEGAHTLLDSLMQHTRLHFGEFDKLRAAQIDLAPAGKNK